MIGNRFWKFALIFYAVFTVGFFIYMALFGWPIDYSRYFFNSWPLFVIPTIGLLWKKQR